MSEVSDNDNWFTNGIDLAEGGRLHEARKMFNKILQAENRKHNAWKRVVLTRAMISTALRVLTEDDSE
ncbi:MAG: hypothetical protein ACXAEN_16040 [Candidatus Thorarchaeota archaeon]|jgi:hypothetical protein